MLAALLRWFFGRPAADEPAMQWDDTEQEWYWTATGERVTWEEWKQYHPLPSVEIQE